MDNTTDAPPEIQAILRKYNEEGKLTQAEKDTLRAYRDSLQTARPTFADSMTQAAGMLGLDITILEAAKRAGCTAFRSSRVYLDELETFLKDFDFDQVDELLEADRIAIEIKREDLRKKKLANDIAEGAYVHLSELGPFLMKLAEDQRSLIRDLLEVRYPQTAQMKTLEQLREIGAAEADDLCSKFQATIEPYLRK